MFSPLRSMRLRMTFQFSLFVAVIMLVGGAAVIQREHRSAETRTRQILEDGYQRAIGEIREKEASVGALVAIVQEEQNEIIADGLVLMVVRGNTVVWRSKTEVPHWPQVNDKWRIRTLAHRGQLLILALDSSPFLQELTAMRRNLMELGLLLVGSTALATWWVVGRTLSPLHGLAEQARDATARQIKVRLESPSSDGEMLLLCETFNGMLARLEREGQLRGSFYASASHELRTPVQALLGQIDVARSRPRTLKEHDEILGHLQWETDRLFQLVQGLLQLNSLEMGQSQPQVEILRLDHWVERAIAQQKGLLEERHIVLTITLPEATILATTSHVEILVHNLLENAVKYADEHKNVRVTLELLANAVQLRVWNSYALPPDGRMEAWLEPFYRGDMTRRTGLPGNGLGLAIVAAIAQKYQWEVHLSHESGGVMVSILIPMVQGQTP